MHRYLSRLRWLLVCSLNTDQNIVNKGRSHKLLRKYLLRKEKEQKIFDEARDKECIESIPSLMNEINDLKNEIMLKDEEIFRLEEDQSILKNLFDKGVIDGEGNVLK